MTFTEVIQPGVNPSLPGIYEWSIDGNARYIGKYSQHSRPRKAYKRNVDNMLAGIPYRMKGRDYRRIHYELAEAVLDGLPITLTFIANSDPGPSLNELEQRLIAKLLRSTSGACANGTSVKP
jgi:hypothetical protein